MSFVKAACGVYAGARCLVPLSLPLRRSSGSTMARRWWCAYRSSAALLQRCASPLACPRYWSSGVHRLPTADAPLALALPHRALVVLRGDTAELLAFLQGLATNDLRLLQHAAAGDAPPAAPGAIVPSLPGRDGCLHTAFLSARGRFLLDANVVRVGEGRLLLECDAAAAPDVVRHLLLYRLRRRIPSGCGAAGGAAAAAGTRCARTAPAARHCRYARRTPRYRRTGR